MPVDDHIDILFLEDTTGSGTTFTRNLEYFLARTGSGRYPAFGAYAGQVTYTGNVRAVSGYYGADQALDMLVASGASMQLGTVGTAATLENHMGITADIPGSAGNGQAHILRYRKTGPGEMTLANITYSYTGSGADPGARWQIFEGTLTTTSSAQLRSTGSVDWDDMFNASSSARTWKAAGGTDDGFGNYIQAYATMTEGSFQNNATLWTGPGTPTARTT